MRRETHASGSKHTKTNTNVDRLIGCMVAIPCVNLEIPASSQYDLSPLNLMSLQQAISNAVSVKVFISVQHKTPFEEACAVRRVPPESTRIVGCSTQTQERGNGESIRKLYLFIIFFKKIQLFYVWSNLVFLLLPLFPAP